MSLSALYDTFSIEPSTGSWATTGTVNDSVHGTGDDQWQLSAGWPEGGGGQGRYNGDNAYSTTTNATDTLCFYGGVDLYSFAGPTTGISAVSVDGGAETNVDEYATVSQGDQLMYSIRGLAAGVEHTVRIRVTGTENPSSTGTVVNVDRAVVIPTTIDNTTTSTGTDQFSYGPGWAAGGETDNGGRYLGTNEYTATAATATMTFIGTRLEFFGTVSGWAEKAPTSIDGGTATPIDQYFCGGTVHGNQLEYQSPS